MPSASPDFKRTPKVEQSDPINQAESRQIVVASPPENADTKADYSLSAIRALVGSQFVKFLQSLKLRSLNRNNSLREEIDRNYLVWAEAYKMIHKEFSELWDLFYLIEQESDGWFRVSPKGTQSFIDINEEGYSFSAGVEKNHSRGAPMPQKWLIVSLAHSDHWANGLGDERSLGRPEPIDDKLIGIKKCNPQNLEKALEYVELIRARIENTPLVFQMFDENLGQRGVKVPLAILQKKSLYELCKNLFLALNKDAFKDFSQHLPPGIKVELID